MLESEDPALGSVHTGRRQPGLGMEAREVERGWVCIPALPLLSCATSGNVLKLPATSAFFPFPETEATAAGSGFSVCSRLSALAFFLEADLWVGEPESLLSPEPCWVSR